MSSKQSTSQVEPKSLPKLTKSLKFNKSQKQEKSSKVNKSNVHDSPRLIKTTVMPPSRQSNPKLYERQYKPKSGFAGPKKSPKTIKSEYLDDLKIEKSVTVELPKLNSVFNKSAKTSRPRVESEIATKSDIAEVKTATVFLEQTKYTKSNLNGARSPSKTDTFEIQKSTTVRPGDKSPKKTSSPTPGKAEQSQKSGEGSTKAMATESNKVEAVKTPQTKKKLSLSKSKQSPEKSLTSPPPDKKQTPEESSQEAEDTAAAGQPAKPKKRSPKHDKGTQTLAPKPNVSHGVKTVLSLPKEMINKSAAKKTIYGAGYTNTEFSITLKSKEASNASKSCMSNTSESKEADDTMVAVARHKSRVVTRLKSIRRVKSNRKMASKSRTISKSKMARISRKSPTT